MSKQKLSKGTTMQKSFITRANIKKKSNMEDTWPWNTQSVGKHRCNKKAPSGTKESTMSWISTNTLREAVFLYLEYTILTPSTTQSSSGGLTSLTSSTLLLEIGDSTLLFFAMGSSNRTLSSLSAELLPESLKVELLDVPPIGPTPCSAISLRSFEADRSWEDSEME